MAHVTSLALRHSHPKTTDCLGVTPDNHQNFGNSCHARLRFGSASTPPGPTRLKMPVARPSSVPLLPLSTSVKRISPSKSCRCSRPKKREGSVEAERQHTTIEKRRTNERRENAHSSRSHVQMQFPCSPSSQPSFHYHGQLHRQIRILLHNLHPPSDW